MKAHPVSPRVSRPENDDADLIAETAGPPQSKLL
jgi:hypothetical protein